jgi:phage shock protein PspC (stress-responsive transcriptional regulator)
MLPAMVLAGATADTIALIVIFFVVFPLLAQGLIAYAIAQALGEKRANDQYQGRAGRQPSQG